MITSEEQQLRELAAEYANTPLGSFFISDTGAERIARRHLQDNIALDDAIIEQCGKDTMFMAFYKLPAEPMTNEQLIAALDPYLPHDWNIQIHRDRLTLCIPCATGPICPECGIPTLPVTWFPIEQGVAKGRPILNVLFQTAQRNAA